MSTLLFYLMLSFLFTHELDAIKRHEWRVMPAISSLSEKVGEQLFIWLHIPLFVVILWFGTSNPNSAFSQCLSGFSMIHIGLHWAFRNHPAYEFNNFSSRLLILGTGVFGAAHLASIYI